MQLWGALWCGRTGTALLGAWWLFVTCPDEVSKGQHSVTCSPLQPQTCAAHQLLQEIKVVPFVSEDKTCRRACFFLAIRQIIKLLFRKRLLYQNLCSCEIVSQCVITLPLNLQKTNKWKLAARATFRLLCSGLWCATRAIDAEIDKQQNFLFY